MNNTFWDPLSIEVRDEINQMEILEQKRTILTDPLGLVWVWHRNAIAGCIKSVGRFCLSVEFIRGEMIPHMGGEGCICICRRCHIECFFDSIDRFLSLTLNSLHAKQVQQDIVKIQEANSKTDGSTSFS